MRFAFQDRQNLYLGLDWLEGGDLRYHICRRRSFSEAHISRYCNLLNEARIVGFLIFLLLRVCGGVSLDGA